MSEFQRNTPYPAPPPASPVSTSRLPPRFPHPVASPPPPGNRPRRANRPDPAGRFQDGRYQVLFDLKTPGILKMAIVGSLLQFITLGIYRFWFLVTIRRQLWQRSSLAGSPFEYTGTPGEIFKGFLIALILLAPIWSCYGLGSWLLQTGQYEDIAGTMVAISIFAFMFFGYFASYRARRYRVSRTLWRGLRFRQTGSGLLYAVMNFGWWLLLLPTLGLSVPFARAQLERYRVNRMWFGNRRFESRSTGRMMFGPYLLYYLAVFGPVALGIAIAFATLPAGFSDTITQDLKAIGHAPMNGRTFAPPSWPVEVVILLTISSLVWLSSMPFLLWPAYRACELRRFIGRISLGSTRFRSKFTAVEIYVCNIIFMLICSVAFTCIAIPIAIAIGIGAAMGVKPDDPGVSVIGAGASYAAIIFIFSILRLRISLFELTGRLIASITIEGVEHLQDVLSRSDRVGAIGDDFAGGFDIGAI